MKITIVILIVLLMASTFAFSGCIIQMEGNEKTAIEMGSDIGGFDAVPEDLTVPKDATFSFNLQGNATTGYTWQVIIEDEEIIELVSNEYVPEETKAVGSGGIATLTFKALERGETILTLEYAQDWDGGEIDKTKDIIVVVE